MSLFPRLLLASIAALFGVVMIGTAPPTDKAIFFYAFGVFCLAITLACVTRARVAAFFGSVIGVGVLAAGMWYVFSMYDEGPATSGQRSEPSLVNALLFMATFGLASVGYLWHARFGLGRQPVEYRTQPLERSALLDELSFFCQVLAGNGVETANVMFGWDSNLDIDDMWQDEPVPINGVVEFVLMAERSGTVTVGKADIFVSARGMEFTLCHESDVHINATADQARAFFVRWNDNGYSPYAVRPKA